MATRTPDPTELDDLGEVRDASSSCQRCELYRGASQTVFGTGPTTAWLVLLGDNPVIARTERGNRSSGQRDGCWTGRWKTPVSNATPHT